MGDQWAPTKFVRVSSCSPTDRILPRDFGHCSWLKLLSSSFSSSSSFSTSSLSFRFLFPSFSPYIPRVSYSSLASLHPSASLVSSPHLTPLEARPSGWLTERRTAYNKPDRAEFLPRRLPSYYFFFVPFFARASTQPKNANGWFTAATMTDCCPHSLMSPGASRPDLGTTGALHTCARKCAQKFWLSGIVRDKFIPGLGK